jgi:hypothetical protein
MNSALQSSFHAFVIFPKRSARSSKSPPGIPLETSPDRLENEVAAFGSAVRFDEDPAGSKNHGG